MLAISGDYPGRGVACAVPPRMKASLGRRWFINVPLRAVLTYRKMQGSVSPYV